MPPVANAEAVGQIVYDFEPSVEARGQRASTERLVYDIEAGADGRNRPAPIHRRGILDNMTLSARNRLEGKIVELQLGGVMAHVVVRVGENLIESVITKRSADEMKLKIGDTVSAIIKSTEVMLEKA
jgi:molybdopterin-binding protein